MINWLCSGEEVPKTAADVLIEEPGSIVHVILTLLRVDTRFKGFLFALPDSWLHLIRCDKITVYVIDEKLCWKMWNLPLIREQRVPPNTPGRFILTHNCSWFEPKSDQLIEAAFFTFSFFAHSQPLMGFSSPSFSIWLMTRGEGCIAAPAWWECCPCTTPLTLCQTLRWRPQMLPWPVWTLQLERRGFDSG